MRNVKELIGFLRIIVCMILLGIAALVLAPPLFIGEKMMGFSMNWYADQVMRVMAFIFWLSGVE